MLWKLMFVACLAVGAVARYSSSAPNDNKITPDRRKTAYEELQQECKENGAEYTTAELEAMAVDFVNCIGGVFNSSAITQEIEEGKRIGALTPVIKKYCQKTAQLKTCFRTYNDVIAKCYKESIREQIVSSNKASGELIDYLCQNDGEKISSFITAEGPECIREQMVPMAYCGGSLMGAFSSMGKFMNLSLKERCDLSKEQSECVVNALKLCANPTPGNMAETILKHALEGMCSGTN